MSMYMVVDPESELTVATLVKPSTRWMLMLWDGQGNYLETQFFRAKKAALDGLSAHCQRLGVPVRNYLA